MQSEVMLEDSMFKFLDFSETVDFYEQRSVFASTKKIAPDARHSETTYAKFVLRASSRTRTYSRFGYGLLDYLGDLGGLFDIAVLMGAMMTGFFTEKLWIASMTKKVYNIQKYFSDLTEIDKLNGNDEKLAVQDPQQKDSDDKRMPVRTQNRQSLF